jgi:ubiquinone/menaquinone biosynthesis C-methylase UbiE
MSGLISTAIEQFYSNTFESVRLELGLGPLEFERNKELIKRHLISPGMVIADVGGGPGLYAEWLAKMGHEVILVDPVPKHVEQAAKRAAKLRRHSYKSILGEARHLDIPDESVDLVILAGPLYHLQKKEERLDALEEARRVLKKEGIVLAVAITSAASTMVGLLNGFIHDPSFMEMCLRELTTGIHTAPEKGWPGILPEAYYQHPEELRLEILSAGLQHIATYAVEGIVWLDHKYFENRSDPAKKESLLNLLRITEQQPSLLGLSPHILASAGKP